MSKISDLHEEWSKDPKYREEYEALQEEFAEVPETTTEKPAEKSAVK